MSNFNGSLGNYRYSYDIALKRLFERANSYKRFEDIDDKTIEEIKELISTIKRNYTCNSFALNPKNNYYQYIVQSLVSNFRLRDLDFDKKMVFFIEACDPECILYQEYEKMDVMDKKVIMDAEVDMEREYLNSQRNKQLGAFRVGIRDKIGFYESVYIQYERDYRNRLVNKETFNTDVTKDYSNNLFNCFDTFPTNMVISPERFNELKEIAMNYISIIGDKLNYKITINSILFQSALLGINNTYEGLILFVMIHDPELNALKLYENGNNLKDIAPSIKECIGFYHKNLIKFETLYHKVYCPDMFISDWTL